MSAAAAREGPGKCVQSVGGRAGPEPYHHPSRPVLPRSESARVLRACGQGPVPSGLGRGLTSGWSWASGALAWGPPKLLGPEWRSSAERRAPRPTLSSRSPWYPHVPDRPRSISCHGGAELTSWSLRILPQAKTSVWSSLEARTFSSHDVCMQARACVCVCMCVWRQRAVYKGDSICAGRWGNWRGSPDRQGRLSPVLGSCSVLHHVLCVVVLLVSPKGRIVFLFGFQRPSLCQRLPFLSSVHWVRVFLEQERFQVLDPVFAHLASWACLP